MNQIRTRSSDEIRRDIELNRSHLGTTIDALVERLSPGELLDQVTHLFRGSPGVKMKRSSSMVVDAMRENPVPLALIGAGIAWLAMESRRDHEDEWDEEDVDRRLRVAAESGRHRAEEWEDGEQDEGPGMRERIGGIASSVAQKGERARSRASETGGRLRARSQRARIRGRERAQRVATGFWDTMESNPLAAGAAVFGVGLVAGLSVPTSRLENRLMGEAADSVRGEARVASRDLALKGKVVAKEAARAAREEADRQDVGPSGIARKAREITREAGHAAKRTAEREGRHGAGRGDGEGRASREHERRDYRQRGDDGERGDTGEHGFGERGHLGFGERDFGEQRGERLGGAEGGFGERRDLDERRGERGFGERSLGERGLGERGLGERPGDRDPGDGQETLDWGESRELARERRGPSDEDLERSASQRRPFTRGRQPFSPERPEQSHDNEDDRFTARRGTREDDDTRSRH